MHRTGLPILQEALPDQHLTDSSLLSSFSGAFSLVSSRAFVCDVYHGLVLAPLADAFNHSDDNDVQFECEDDVCFRCGALAACPHRRDVDAQREGVNADTIDMTLRGPVIASGDGSRREIFNSYGPLSNARLLVSYGFAQATETEWERFAWDWDDEQERAEVVAALELEDAEVRRRWAEVCASLAGQAIQQALLASAAEKTRHLQIPTPSPLYHLGSKAKPLGDLFALPLSPDDVDGFTHDVDYPLFVDGDGNVSICLWPAAWASVVAREGGPTSCKETLLAELAESEDEVAKAMSEESTHHNSLPRARERALQALALVHRLVSQRRAGLSVSSPEKEQEALDLLDQDDEQSSLPKDATVRYALLCAIQEHAALRAAEGRLEDAIEMLQQGAEMTG